MVSKERVFIAEDDPEWLGMLLAILSSTSYEVACLETNLSDALEAVDRFEELGIDVALVDGNLKEGDVSGDDGRQMIEKIREIAPWVVIIGYSNAELEGVDYDLRKYNTSQVDKVIEAVLSDR